MYSTLSQHMLGYTYIYIRGIYLLPNIMNFDDEWMPEWTGAPFTNMLQLYSQNG